MERQPTEFSVLLQRKFPPLEVSTLYSMIAMLWSVFIHHHVHLRSDDEL
jgi:hypothetical protein